MNETWEKFESWLKENWVEGFEDLNPPATDQEISELESALGVQLPADFVACLRVHNGQGAMAGGLLDNSEFLSTGAILDQWTVWKDLLDSGDFKDAVSEPDPGVKNDWWNPKWIPFSHNGGGDHDCLDLDPAVGGKVGQVIGMWHDAGNREVQAESFGAWFEEYVDAVLDGQYKYSEDFGGLMHIDYA